MPTRPRLSDLDGNAIEISHNQRVYTKVQRQLTARPRQPAIQRSNS